jgi:polysaccharide chain length determinant protein (PEP-CTERM system associated)
MEELLTQAISIARSMWRFRWLALGVAWMVAIVGTIIAFRVPDRYEASARIYVDTQSILKPLMQGLAVQPNVDQQVGMLSRTLISRPNIEKLIRMADLDLKTSSKGQQDALIEQLMKTVEIKSTGRDNLYSLAFVDPDKEKAKRVIQSMVSIFVESSLGASRKDTDSAKVFLDEQIKNYEAKLEEAESRLKEFRIRNIELQSGDGKDAASRIGEIVTQLESAKLGLHEAENARDSAKAQLAAEKGESKGSDVTQSLLAESKVSFSTPEIDARIDAQRRNLDALLQRYTDAHPDVVNTRRLLKDLEEQKRKEVAELRKVAMATTSSSAPSFSNPAVTELAKLVANAEVQVAALKARVNEYAARYAQAKQMSKLSPQVEAEAAQLNRDYGIIKKNYEDLVARRQSAVMSGDLDVASGIADFRLIDPPRVSQTPVSPNRMLLLAAVLVATMAAGVATAFAASILRPTFNDANELRAKTGLPLVGIVSLAIGDPERQLERVDRMRFFAGTGSLLGLLMIGMVTVAILAARQLG